MAEIAVSAALVAVQLVVPFLSELKPNHVSKDVDKMKIWLKRMQVYIETNDYGGGKMLEEKVDRIRNIAYEIEDVLDEILFHSPHLFRKHKITQKIHKIGHSIKHWFPLSGIPGKIQGILSKIDDFQTTNNFFGDGSLSRPASSSGTRVGDRMRPLLDDEMVGYTKLKDDFMNSLEDADKRLATLAVVGPVGSGKTTLVDNVFKNPMIQGRFGCRAWIHMSNNFDEKEVFNQMLDQLRDWGKESCRTCSEYYLVAELRKYLQTKRYIIVLDDIQKHEHFDCIKRALPDGLFGSKIIVTTRNSNVASSCACPSTLVFELKGLEGSDAWTLFCKIAFKEVNGDCPSELKRCGSNIVKRCEGLPLAIVAVGSALAQKRMLPVEWERFNRSLGHEIGINNPHLSIIRNTLISSYLDLPSNMKSCFLYFSLFPEDYSIEIGRLIRLWVAERIVMGSESYTPEEVGEHCLNELIQRNLVYVSKKDFDGRPRNCRVLNLVLTFIVQKCIDENFMTIFPKENTSVRKNIRRLAVHGDCSHIPQDIDFSIVRSMFVLRCGSIHTSHIVNNFQMFKLLKVLELQGAPLTKFPDSITYLTLLTYLSLRNTNISKIPNSIDKLFYLETLDLKQTDVRELPKEISELRNLRYLFAYKRNLDSSISFDSVQGVKFFEGIGNLTNIQKLSRANVGKKGRIIKELKQLVKLRKLGLMGLRGEHGENLSKSLEELKNLTTLDLCSNTENDFLEVGGNINPSRSIQKLYLKGRLNAFPRWISSLDSLLRIGLKWSKSNENPLQVLKHLPNLMEVQLVDCFERDKLIFEKSTFKELKILLIENLSTLNTVAI